MSLDHPLDGLCADLGLGTRARSILAAMDRFYARADAAIAAGAADADLPCQAGCDLCCHEAVFVSAPEFLAVAAHLMTRVDASRRRALVGQMTEIAARFEDELLMLETLSAGAERDEVARRVRFRCPLLESSGRCSVYPVRELNARTFGHSRDEVRSEPFGCALTHERLRVLPSETTARLVGARALRHQLRHEVPGVGAVHVYPWWFSRYGHWI